MARAWTCVAEPMRHGSFLQSGLYSLAEDDPSLQPEDRLACPICCANGKDGWVRPATAQEASTLKQPQGV